MPSLPELAFKNVTRARRRSGMVCLAVTGGCAALVFMLSMNNGLAEMMVTNATGLMLGHVEVDAASGERTFGAGDELSIATRLDGVAGAAPRLELPALIHANPPRGALLLGIDVARERGASTLPQLVTAGRLPALDDGPSVAMGTALAERLGLHLGDRFPVSFLDASNNHGNASLQLIGLIRTGTQDLDEGLVLAPLPEIQRLVDDLEPHPLSRLVIRAQANADTDRVAASLTRALASEPLRVRTWRQVSPFLAAMVSFQHGSAGVVLFFLYAVVGAGVAAIQLMSVLERTRELAVLSSLGFSPARVVGLIAMETALVGALAAGIGTLAGALLVSFVASHGGIDVRIAGGEGLEGLMGLDPHLRPVLSLRAWVCGMGAIAPVLLLGGVLPAARAARMTPMDALRRL